MSPRGHYPVEAAGWIFMLCALLLLTVGSWVQSLSFESGMIITEYLLVLLPVVLTGLFLKVDLKRALRLKALKLREVILIPIAVVLSLPITLFLNLLTIAGMAQLGKAYDMPIPAAENLSQLSLLFFIISISAGICEEFFFRGMVLDAYAARFGARKGILISAVLFGLFHFNPQNLLGPIFLGLLFGYLVMITDSLLAGILGHMTNNGVAVMMMYIGNRAQQSMEAGPGGAELINSNPDQMLMAVLVLGVIAVGSLLAVAGVLSAIAAGRRLPKPEGAESAEAVYETRQQPATGIRIFEVFPILLPAAVYTAVSYYLIVIK